VSYAAAPALSGDGSIMAGMDDLDTDRLMSDYVNRHPAAQMALRDDPAFQFQMESLRRTIDLLLPALRREGLDPMAARRVVNTILYGVPEPDEAILRIAETRVRVAEAMLETPVLVLDAETAWGFFGEGVARS
jgi:hypothetical protein